VVPGTHHQNFEVNLLESKLRLGNTMAMIYAVFSLYPRLIRADLFRIDGLEVWVVGPCNLKSSILC
jgi:hypothetical protein